MEISLEMLLRDTEQRANRALLELALQLRLIDDRVHLSEYFKTTDEHSG
jgi:hypothetical protein